MDKAQFDAIIRRVRRGLRVTKVVATRSVKTPRGDFFAGFAAAWDSVQDDAGGPGADLDLVTVSSEAAAQGMDLREAVVAQGLVAMQADLAAYRAALANGAISADEYKEAAAAVTRNYTKAMQVALKVEGEV